MGRPNINEFAKKLWQIMMNNARCSPSTCQQTSCDTGSGSFGPSQYIRTAPAVWVPPASDPNSSKKKDLLMSENKTKPTDGNVDEFLASIENDRRRDDAMTMCKMILEVTGKKPVMWGPTMVGFGTYHYKYDSGREGDWFVAGFAPRKARLVVYIMSGFKRHDALMKKLGKHKTGGSCLYINKLSDVDMDILRELVSRSVEYVSSTSV